MWQDIVFSFGGLILALTLVPTLLDSSSQVPRVTSIPTTIILLVFAVTFGTLELYFSAAVHLLTASVWAGIAIWRA